MWRMSCILSIQYLILILLLFFSENFVNCNYCNKETVLNNVIHNIFEAHGHSYENRILLPNDGNSTKTQIECIGQVTLNQRFQTSNLNFNIYPKNYPYYYPNNHLCTIIMNVEEAFNGHIELKFEEFHIEHSKKCVYDYLSISDDKQTAKFCGKAFKKDSRIKSHSIDNNLFAQSEARPTLNKSYIIKPNGSLLIQFKSGRKNNRYDGFLLTAKFLCGNSTEIENKTNNTPSPTSNGKTKTTIKPTTITKEPTTIKPTTTTKEPTTTIKPTTTAKPTTVTKKPTTTTRRAKKTTRQNKYTKRPIYPTRSPPVRNIQCNRNDYEIKVGCNMGKLRITVPRTRKKNYCAINLSFTRRNIRVEFQFLSFNLNNYGGYNYDALTFASGLENNQFIGKLDRKNFSTEPRRVLRGRRSSPKFGKIYYAEDLYEMRISYFEFKPTGGDSFELVMQTKCL